jgi:hypothetical protein
VVTRLSIGDDLGDCPVVELRRYRLRPGHFDSLQQVFQKELVEPQIAAGMRLGGQFGDRDDPDRFVWFRGFASMERRHQALEGFYRGPVWREHADEANATMLDSDDVLLLRPTTPPHPPAPAVAFGDVTGEEWAALQVLELPDGDEQLDAWISRTYHATLERVSGRPVAMWRTEHSHNTFAALPVRAGHFFVALMVCSTADEWAQISGRLSADEGWLHCDEKLRLAGVDIEWTHLRPTRTSRHPRSPKLGFGEGAP